MLDLGAALVGHRLPRGGQFRLGPVGPLGLGLEGAYASSVEPLDVLAPALSDRESEVDTF